MKKCNFEHDRGFRVPQCNLNSNDKMQSVFDTLNFIKKFTSWVATLPLTSRASMYYGIINTCNYMYNYTEEVSDSCVFEINAVAGKNVYNSEMEWNR